MPPKTTHKKKLPKWAVPVGAVVLGGAVIWWLFFRNRSNQSVPVSTGYSPAVQGANSGQPSTVSAPADSLGPGVLDALGISLAQTGGLGGVLGNVAMNAQSALNSIANQTVQSSFEFGSNISASAFASQAAVIEAALSYGGGGGGGGASQPAGTSKGTAKPFGGVVRTTVNPKTGVKNTYYASGRIVTQAPGKSAYVSKK